MFGLVHVSALARLFEVVLVFELVTLFRCPDGIREEWCAPDPYWRTSA